MRMARNALFAVGTLTVVAIGLLLPDIVFLAQCGIEDRTVTRFETAQAEFDIEPSDTAITALRIVSQESTAIDLDEGRKLDAGGAHAAVREALDFFEEKGIDLSFYTDASTHTERPYLAVNEEDGQAAVLWNCLLVADGDPETYLTALVDDATGKAVSFSLTRSDAESQGDRTGFEAGDALLWAEAWASYLGFGYTVLSDGAVGSSDTARSAEEDAAVDLLLNEHTAVVWLDGGDMGLGVTFGLSDGRFLATIRSDGIDSAVSVDNQDSSRQTRIEMRPLTIQ